MHELVNRDIQFITTMLGTFNGVVDGKNIPDYHEFLHQDAEIKFNNETYNCDECANLVHDFCAATQSMDVTIVKPIECLNEEERIYLVLSNWDIVSLADGSKASCPMIETIAMRDDKIIQAKGVISMGGELNSFLTEDITVKTEALAR